MSKKEEQLAKVRKLHFDSLKKRIPFAEKLSSNGELWIIQIMKQDGTPYYSFKIAIPDQFPIAAPIISLENENMLHPWVDGNKNVVGHPLLNGNWSSQSDLGNLMADILKQFHAIPPQITGGQNYRSRGYGDSMGNSKRNEAVKAANIPTLPFPHEMPMLKSMSTEDLERLESNPEALNVFVYNIPNVAEMINTLRVYTRRNEDLVKRITELSRQTPQLDAAAAKELETLNAQVDEVKKSLAAQQKCCKKYEDAAAIASLLRYAQESKTEVEALREKLYNKELGWQEFETQFLSKQQAHHRLRALREKLMHNSSQQNI